MMVGRVVRKPSKSGDLIILATVSDFRSYQQLIGQGASDSALDRTRIANILSDQVHPRHIDFLYPAVVLAHRVAVGAEVVVAMGLLDRLVQVLTLVGEVMLLTWVESFLRVCTLLHPLTLAN